MLSTAVVLSKLLRKVLRKKWVRKVARKVVKWAPLADEVRWGIGSGRTDQVRCGAKLRGAPLLRGG